MKLRSIRAVLAGFFAVLLLSVATDAALAGIHPFPFAWATIYRTLYAVVGGYVTARLAPDRPRTHVMILTLVGTALATIGAISTWDKGPDFGPHWYPLSLIVTAPITILGGKLAANGSHQS